MFSVKDKTIIVTGAAKGNGKAIADGFVNAGSVVYYVDLLDGVLTNVKIDKTHRSKAFILDITDTAQLDKFINPIIKVSALVNNAGITLPSDDSQSLKNWDKTIRVNLTAVYDLSRKVAEKMKYLGGGSILNITSISSYMGSVGNPAYHASKGGVRHLTKSIAADYGKYNIRANNICPGYFNTDMTNKTYSDINKHEMILKRIMLGKWGESDDLVGACIFLVSDASSYITGSDILVDGGLINKGF